MVWLVLAAAPAAAHADIVTTTPSEGTRVAEPPSAVSVSLSERPADGSEIIVTDGCRREVSGEAQLGQLTLSTSVEGGQPGHWEVQVNSVSAEDRHLVEDSYSFQVFGENDCEAAAGPGDNAAEPDGENEETSFPFVPVVVGTAALVALALALAWKRPWRKR